MQVDTEPDIPLTKPLTSRSEQLQKLDEEITQLEKQLYLLRSRRNSLVPIAILPNEVLQHIFLIAHQGAKGPSRCAGKISLLVSWVSKHWREIALDTPSLWSYVDFHDPRWVELAISRTRKRPLQLTLHFWNTFWLYSSLISLIFSNLSRTQKLDLVVWTGVVNAPMLVTTPLPGIWDIQAPQLEELSLQAVGVYNPSKVMNFPLLSTLNLDGCEFDWDTIPLFPNLISLTVYDASDLIPVDQFVNTILNPLAERLEVLVIGGVLRNPNIMQPLSTERLNLAQLKKFSPGDDPDLLRQLFQRISVPHNTRVTLPINSQSPGELAMLSEFVSCRNAGRWPVKSIDISQDEENKVAVAIQEDWDVPSGELGGDYYFDTTTNPSELGLIKLMFPSNLPVTLPVLQVIPLTPIKCLIIRGSSTFDFTQILDEFSGVASIEYWSIGCSALANCASWMRLRSAKVVTDVGVEQSGMPLDDVLDVGLEQTRNLIRFPSLQELRLSGSDLDEEYDPLPGHPEDSENILAWLKARKSLGIPIQRVLIDYLELDEEMYVEFGRYGGMDEKVERR